MNKIRLLCFFVALATLVSSSGKAFSQSQIDLTKNWKFRKASSNDPWLNAFVPGSVHNDLLLNSVIEDPYTSCNHRDMKWIEETEWEYSLDFEVDKNNTDQQKHILVFEGLDTYADVFLNGKLILQANNMFRTWKIDVTNSLQNETNNLRVEFKQLSGYLIQRESQLGYKLPGGEWAHARKAAFQFGWDFAPRMVTCGIWQPVYIQTIAKTSLCDGHIITQSVDSINAQLLATYTINSSARQNVKLKVVNTFDWQSYIEKDTIVNPGEQIINLPFPISNPMFWWPSGMGPQFLYNLALVLETKETEAQIIRQQVGIRSIEIVNEPDEHGTSFYFLVNKKPLFAKGANIVPPHSFLPAKPKNWVRLAIDAKQSNMNMLRVWGGGIYPPDEFYQACDSLGILVWQDFMFACSMYPWDYEYLENVKIEAVQQVNRLKKFASLAMWCGNNEVDEGWHNWGWQTELNDSARVVAVWEGYRKVFHEILPSAVKEHDAGRFYWSSSPQHGWGRAESMSHGDSHYWGVWWGKEPFDKYKEKVPRFMSEYGFQGFPVKQTVISFTGNSDLPETTVLACHQKHPVGFETIDLQMKREGFKPENLDERVYFSQVTQAIGYQTAIEAHRLASPRCMGTLYWQLNDCWPGVSWSSIDYFGNWKAVLYQVKRSYAPLIVAPSFEGNNIVVRVVSDSPGIVEGDVIVNIYTPYGKKIGVWKEFVRLRPNSARKVIDEKLFEDPSDRIPLIAVAQFVVGVNNAKYGFAANEKWGDLELRNPKIEVLSLSENGVNFIELKSSNYAFFVELSGEDNVLKFDDNYFHMVPGKKYRFRINQDKINGIVVKSLWDYIEQ